ncbi:MAG: homoserine O-succinyltransferase [Candidatus Dasytiphilus stammeri]
MKHILVGHLNKFYYHFDNIRNEPFDTLIITAVPLGLFDFLDVTYWKQIKAIFT